MAGKPSSTIPRRNSFCVTKQTPETEKKEKQEGSGHKAKVRYIEKTDTKDPNITNKENKPDEINILSLFHLIQETAREQKERITRIEENIGVNNNLLKETNQKLTQDIENIKVDVTKNKDEINTIKEELNSVKETIDPEKLNLVDEQSKSAICLAEKNLSDIEQNKTKITELQEEMKELKSEIQILKEARVTTPSIPLEASNRPESLPQPQPTTSSAQQKKSYAQILQEEKKKRYLTASAPEMTPTPIFITSDKSARDIFDEAKHYVGIDNVNTNEIRKYLWQGESDDDTDPSDLVSDIELMYSTRYKEERINAVTGILTDRFGFYLSEIQINDAWYCNLRGPGSIYISSNNKYFIRSVYWKAAAARDRVHRVSPWIPLAASERKIELERRLARIRKTQTNLRTQVRLGEEDFDVFGKISNTGRTEKFEIIPREKYDPNEDLPRIKCKETSINNQKDDILEDATRRLNEAARNVPDGWSPVTNKRKERSPINEDGSKKNRKFSPNQAGKSIINQIKNRGIPGKDETDTDESESDESVLEETVHSHDGTTGHEPVNSATVQES